VRRRRILITLLLVSLLAATSAVIVLRDRQRLYRVTFLPSLGGDVTAATGINDRGQVTGFAQTPDGVFHFFLWDRENGVQDLGPALDTNFCINEAGQIAGTTRGAAGNRLAFLWERAQGMRVLGTLGGSESAAVGLNNHGRVVGWSHTAAGASHAFIWDQTTGMRDLGTFGGAKSDARWISDTGQVFGLADSATEEFQPFFWNCEKGMTAAGPPALPKAMWYGMNTRGYALGIERDGRLFLWREDVGIRRLFRTGGSYMLPVVNDANQILFGEAFYGALRHRVRKLVPPAFHCYLWDPNRGRISLDDCVRPKWDKNLYLWDLNNQGCLVGALANERGLRGRAVLLEPIPQQWGRRPLR
jgi:probable HAF family extracellular repeat protein